MSSWSDCPTCPRCHRRMLPEQGAVNLAIRGGEKIDYYYCGESMSWHVWAPDIEQHPDQYVSLG